MFCYTFAFLNLSLGHRLSSTRADFLIVEFSTTVPKQSSVLCCGGGRRVQRAGTLLIRTEYVTLGQYTRLLVASVENRESTWKKTLDAQAHTPFSTISRF
ncbi:uncharacterized protein BDZ99DRAFT_215512 [Mytilinidion resinicola]|uniref:Uncharacterized protein n=1 Tax=Mytilinidion resinicola TaxID=574789 RepID=A0A6A6Y0Y8_9PEZI|nr:uncharacterized protein BDZ99DRAFT_215512 [Mytilinidion resinicola]KAF2801684.1 hypothetical protein BDZ99DRAFT_215512 [Mytilinidion resinicola]